MASNFATAEILAAPIDIAAELWASSPERAAGAFAADDDTSNDRDSARTETPRASQRSRSALLTIGSWLTADRARKWLYCSLAVLVACQFYFVRELAAALGLFALGFAAVAGLIIALYMLLKSWELAVARLLSFRRPVLQISPVPHDQRKPA